ncbi:MAG: hypothetical protein ACLP3Q_11075 [Streptosporangiaceae bacterium]
MAVRQSARSALTSNLTSCGHFAQPLAQIYPIGASRLEIAWEARATPNGGFSRADVDRRQSQKVTGFFVTTPPADSALPAVGGFRRDGATKLPVLGVPGPARRLAARPAAAATPERTQLRSAVNASGSGRPQLAFGALLTVGLAVRF